MEKIPHNYSPSPNTKPKFNIEHILLVNALRDDTIKERKVTQVDIITKKN